MKTFKSPRVGKAQLVVAVARKTRMVRADVLDVVNAVVDEIAAALARHDTVTLAGLGSFVPKVRKGGIGRALDRTRTPGAGFRLPDRLTLKFIPADPIKRALSRSASIVPQRFDSAS